MCKNTIILALSLLLLSGCTHSLKNKSPEITVTSSPFTVFNGEYENTDAIKDHPPVSIAVLPFVGDEEDFTLKLKSEDPRNIVRTGFYNQISSLPYRDQEMHVTDSRLERAGFFSAEDVHQVLKNDPKQLSGILGVNAAVAGRVTHFDRVFAGLGSQVAVGCEVWMIDLDTGELLWQAKHVSRGFAGGVAVSPVGMIINAVASLWNLRQVQLYRETDNLFREMADTIYVPPELMENREEPPMIAMFTAVEPDRTYKMGDKVRFRLLGDPGGRAFVQIQGTSHSVELSPVTSAAAEALKRDIAAKVAADRAQSGLPMSQEASGQLAEQMAALQIYEGAYTVPPGYVEHNAGATVTLVSKGGVPARMAHPGGLDFDADPPAAPEGLTAEPLNEKARLTWRPGKEKDLAKYEVFASSGVNDEFTKIGECLSAEYTANDLANFDAAYFKARAVDQAGNTGEFSQVCEARPTPEPGATGLSSPGPVLSGVISKPVYLSAASGPYRVEGEFRIAPGGALILGPGTEIGFASGAGMTVSGEIAAYGEKERPVLFSPLAPGAKSGSYQGLALKGATRALLRHVRITGARVGLTVEHCSPDMAGVLITDSAQAGMHLLDGATPTMTNSTIAANNGLGGLVMEGEGLAPAISSTVFRDNSAFDVQSYAQTTIDLSGNYWDGDNAARALGNLRLEPALESPPEDAP